MQHADKGRQGVFIDEDLLRILVENQQATLVQLGAIRLILEKCLIDGGADHRSLEIAHGVSELTERGAAAIFSQLVEQKPQSMAQLLQDLNRLCLQGPAPVLARHPLTDDQ